jgi:hypothetical protein
MGEKEHKEDQGAGAAEFNLAHEAEQVMQAFPHLRDHSIFAMADAKTYNPDHPVVYGHAKTVAGNRGLIKKKIERSLRIKSSLVSYPIAGNRSKTNLVVINPDSQRLICSNAMTNAELATKQILSFDHEMGHLVTPTGHDIRLNESSADAYMALRLFQRQGEAAADILSRFSDKRARDIFTDSTYDSYLTGPVIDKIIKDSKAIDFKLLSPEETAKLASRYARENHPEYDAIRRACIERSQYKYLQSALQYPSSHNDIPRLLAATVLASEHSLSFYIGARFFQPFLQAEGTYWADKKIILPDSLREELHANITERAKYFNLQSSLQDFDMRKNGLTEGVVRSEGAPAAVQTAQMSLQSIFTSVLAKYKEKIHIKNNSLKPETLSKTLRWPR